MASLATPSCPNSFQLILGCKCRQASLIFVRTQVRTVDRRVRLRVAAAAGSATRGGDGEERKNSGDSWINSEAPGDAFTGWFGANSGGSQGKRGLGGIVGAGVAGVILVAGLVIASLSLSKRNASGPKQQMEPLTSQQEMLLASDDEKDTGGQVGSEENTSVLDEGCLHNDLEQDTGINNDSSSCPDIYEASFESRPSDSVSVGISLIQNVESASCDIDSVKNYTQEGSQATSGSADMQAPLDFDPSFPKIPDSDTAYTPDFSSLKDPESKQAAGMLDSTIGFEENLITVNLDNPSVSGADSTIINSDHQEGTSISSGQEHFMLSVDLSSSSDDQIPDKPLVLDNSVTAELGVIPGFHVESEYAMKNETSVSTKEDYGLSERMDASREGVSSYLDDHKFNENDSSGLTPVFLPANPDTSSVIDMSSSIVESLVLENSLSSAGIPAPSLLSAALQVHPGKVLVPAVIDQVHGQPLAALQVLKVIEADVQPSDICTRREYARWLVSASNTLSRNSVSKVYPAMYIENVTELAFDDITPEDPDFSAIQGLAEAGLIASKLSRHDLLQSSDGDQDPVLFFPESPLSRQDLVSWKMAVEKRQLPEVDRKLLYQSCGFIDLDKINPDAWPAIVADQSAGEQGIMALAFGYTRLFQPDKPVTKGQAAVALATGEATDVVNEELARIEAESVAETAVAAHTALVAEVEKDINASFEKELSMEREKIDAIEKMAQEARQELERLRTEREEENNSLIRERAAVETEMGVLSRIRCDVEEHLQSLMSDKMQISFERERINKLWNEAESENQTIARLQYELEVERKALSMARAWAEDEAKRAREQAKALEEARYRWERHGIKVVVDSDLQEDANAGVIWLNAGKRSFVDETVSRAESLVSKLKLMASEIRGNSKMVIERIILKVTSLISNLKERATEAARQAGEFQGAAISRASESVEQFRQRAIGLSSALKDGAKRVADDCREGVGKISQKFKA